MSDLTVKDLLDFLNRQPPDLLVYVNVENIASLGDRLVFSKGVGFTQKLRRHNAMRTSTCDVIHGTDESRIVFAYELER